MLRRTFIALAGTVGILNNTGIVTTETSNAETTAAETGTTETTNNSDGYDIYPGDDADTIQAALDDMSLVEAAPSDYSVSRKLVIPDHTTLRGDGEHRTTFHAAGPCQFESEDRPATGISFERLTVDGHNHGANGLKLSSCHDVTVRNVEVREGRDMNERTV